MSTARLVVAFGGQEQWDITGDRESMLEQYRELSDILQAVDGVHDKFFELTGFRNQADRKPERFIARVEDIRGVDLQET